MPKPDDAVGGGPVTDQPASDTAPLSRRVLHGASWAVVGGLVSRVGTVILFAALGRLLGREQFGGYAIATATALLLSTIAGGPISSMASRYVSLWRKRDDVKCGEMVGLSLASGAIFGVLLTALLYSSSGPLADHVFQDVSLRRPLRLASLIVGLGVLQSVAGGVLVGLSAFRAQAMVSIGATLAAAAVAIPLAAEFGTNGAILGFVAAGAFNTALTLYAVLRRTRSCAVTIRLRLNRDILAALRTFAIPAFLAGLVVAPINWAGPTLLVRSEFGSAGMGRFAAATYISSAILLLPGLVGPVLLPLLVESTSLEDRGRAFERMAALNTRLILALTIPLAVLLSLAADPLIRGLYGRGFAGGGLVLTIASISAALQATGTGIGQLFVSTGRMWIALAANTWSGILFIVFCLIMIPRWGAEGLAAANAAEYAEHAILLLILRVTVLQVPINGQEKVQLLLALACTITTVVLSRMMPEALALGLSVPLAIASFIALSLGGLAASERLVLRNLLTGTFSRMRV